MKDTLLVSVRAGIQKQAILLLKPMIPFLMTSYELGTIYVT